jgi:benzoyl-CoA-dihydrodiol lyase
VAAHDRFLIGHADNWLIREIVLCWKRTRKRLDVSSRTLFALVEPGSCSVGLLAELILASDRSYMFEGERQGDERPPPVIRLTEMNFGPRPMPNDVNRLETRFYGEPERWEEARTLLGKDLDSAAADAAGLVTFVLDEIDWDEELRLALEERASFSPDSLSRIEANLRFPGPETMETKIFELSAWQDWIFSRPNASGERGSAPALRIGRAAYL